MLQAIYPDARHRPFLLGVVVTDSITVNAAWYAAPADFYCVPNEQTGDVLKRAGVAADCIHAFGFPVSPKFAEPQDPAAVWEPGRTLRILQILNHGTRKAVKTTRRLLKVPQSQLTIVTGRNPKLRRKLEAATGDQAERVTVMGWTDRMPELMRQSHLIVTKAGGATVQEALAAGRPVILTQVVPGQEEGNAEFVSTHGMGAIARRPRCRRSPQGLLCDFHAHSTYSDGRLELPEVVSFYGRQGFDVLCITDHIADRRRIIGRLGEQLRLTLSPLQVAEYFDLLERERRRAWTRYGMLLMAGLEFNQEGFTTGSSTHLLGVGLAAPIDPSLPLREIMAQIRDQNGLVIAPHPHRFPHRPRLL
jgi:hypothetical protein